MEWRKNVISADIEKRQKHMRDFMQDHTMVKFVT